MIIIFLIIFFIIFFIIIFFNNDNKLDNDNKSNNINKISKIDKQYYYSSKDDYIISEEEQKIIVDWISKNYTQLEEIRKNSWMRPLDELENVPELIWDLKRRIIEKENLHNAIQDPVYKDAIGYMIGDSELQIHTDPNQDNLIHTRFNVYVQLPEEGGYPIYDGKLYKLKERTYICCRAGIDKHLCSDVKGKKPRVMISFGFQLPYDRVKNIKYFYD